VRALLDVNLLIALFDSTHVHHERAHAWRLAALDQGWATCPLTQNGFLRVVCSRGYHRPLSPADAFAVLGAQMDVAGHEFWPADISLYDQLFDRSRVLGPKQLTDVYLLGLAVRRNGRLATFDRRIPLRAVRGAEPKHLTVI
jgi:toxin-antitoxin system PIN domain toxin